MPKPSVFGWKADNSGCGHYRVDVPFEALANKGWSVTTSTILDKTLTQADLIFAQRTCMPSAAEYLQDQIRRNVPVIVDMDDLLLNIDPWNENAYIWYGAAHIRQCLEESLRNAVVVTASTVALAQRLCDYNENVYVLPNTVPESLIDAPVSDENRNRRASEHVTVGWAGSDTHAADIGEVAYPVRRALNWNPNALMLFVGADYQDQVRKPDQTAHIGWLNKIADYYSALDKIDIGLAPLIPSEFNKCKSAIKALEYAARGIPIIASDYGPYADFVIDGETGFLCNTQAEWMDALQTLIRDDLTRVKMGEAAKRQARLMTADRQVSRYEALFTALGN